jgi:hypothetical protein
MFLFKRLQKRAQYESVVINASGPVFVQNILPPSLMASESLLVTPVALTDAVLLLLIMVQWIPLHG